MDREKLKLIVKNLKLLVESLESEVLSDPSSYVQDTGDWKELYYDPNGDDFDEVYSQNYGTGYRITNDDDGDGI
jgi:hypothetical protein